MKQHRQNGYGLDLSNLPATRGEAQKIGSAYFFTGRPCAHGHVDARYTKGGSCCWCARSGNAAKAGRTFTGEMPRGLANAARAKASAAGELTYVPTRPCKLGHMLRWVASTNCVECDKLQREKHARRKADARIVKLYGLSPSDHQAMFERQDQRCAICGKHHQDRFEMHIDHCHDSGHVRGLLCSRCNQAIGLLLHDPKIITAAARYCDGTSPISKRGHR